MEKNSQLTAQMNDFVALFNRIEKTFSFNRSWIGEKGSMSGVVIDPEHRLIMEHGEVARTTDQYKRKAILLGTHFGIIAIYPTMLQPSRIGIPTLSFYTTEALKTAIGQFFEHNTTFVTTGKLVDHADFPFLSIDALFALIGEIAQFCEERHMYVGDGMKKVKRKRTFHKQPPQQKKQVAASKKPDQGQQPKKASKPNRQSQHKKTTDAPDETLVLDDFTEGVVADLVAQSQQETQPEQVAQPEQVLHNNDACLAA